MISPTPRILVEYVADAVLRRTGLLHLVRLLADRNGTALRILGYHRVCDPGSDPLHGDPHVISATPQTFAEQMRLLVRYYRPVGWPELCSGLREGRPLPRRAVLVTFDDGYRDFLTHAWPILRSHKVPVVLFVSTTFPDSGRRFWWDLVWQHVRGTRFRHAALPGVGTVPLWNGRQRWSAVRALVRQMRPMRPEAIEERLAALGRALGTTGDGPPPVLSWDELRRLSREGVVVAAHGHTHASLAALTTDEIVREIEAAHTDLRRELGNAPEIFAYPFGHYDERAAVVLRRLGFVAAIGTGHGSNTFPARNPFSLFRQSVNVAHSLSRIQLGLSGFYRSAETPAL